MNTSWAKDKIKKEEETDRQTTVGLRQAGKDILSTFFFLCVLMDRRSTIDYIESNFWGGHGPSSLGWFSCC